MIIKLKVVIDDGISSAALKEMNVSRKEYKETYRKMLKDMLSPCVSNRSQVKELNVSVLSPIT